MQIIVIAHNHSSYQDLKSTVIQAPRVLLDGCELSWQCYHWISIHHTSTHHTSSAEDSAYQVLIIDESIITTATTAHHHWRQLTDTNHSTTIQAAIGYFSHESTLAQQIITDQISGIDGVVLKEDSSHALSWKIKQVLMRKKLERQLKLSDDRVQHYHRLAHCDELTGLANLRQFQDQLHQKSISIHPNQALSVIMLDVDHFKTINRRMSHHAGSQVLIQLAQIIQAQIRSTDLAARYGGDEFVIILTQSELAVIKRLTERIMRAIKTSTFTYNNQTLTISVSCGVATSHTLSPDPQHLKSQLVILADQWLAQAKQSGRDCYVFNGTRYVLTSPLPTPAVTAVQ